MQHVYFNQIQRFPGFGIEVFESLTALIRQLRAQVKGAMTRIYMYIVYTFKNHQTVRIGMMKCAYLHFSQCAFDPVHLVKGLPNTAVALSA